MKDAAYGTITFIVGLLAAGLRVVYFFFPGFNVMDAVVFGGLGACLAYFRPARWPLWSLLLVLPAMALIARTLARLGYEYLSQGVGTGHAVSAIVVPAAAFGGAFLAARRSGRSTSSFSEDGV